jgi:hypothetical protein
MACDPASCPTASSECVDVICNPDGTCGESPKPDGPAAAQTPADCMSRTCTGGLLTVENDDADAPDDGNECTDDACDNGVAVTTSTPVDTPCGTGGAQYCDGKGACVDCTVAEHCASSPNECVAATCVEGTCGTENEADGAGCDDEDGCTQSDTCQSGVCVGANPKVCGFGMVCSAGSCVGDVIAYLKASNTNGGDSFGYSVALSADGDTLAVGAVGESSPAVGVGGNQADNFFVAAGAVYVFKRVGGLWSQEAYIKASNTNSGDNFGYSVALSADGDTLAVGAYFEDSLATGIGGDQFNNGMTGSGAVYVLTRSGGVWSQQAYVKASNTGALDHFGGSVALSGDGDTLAVGAYGEDSGATGVGGDQADNSAPDSGAVYVLTRSGGVWSQQAYVKASNTGAGDSFGLSVALSGDGDTLAVGATAEDSGATGINGNPSDDSAAQSGAAYVLGRSAGVWSQQAYVKASNTGAGDSFGYSLALSADGGTLAVGAPGENSSAVGIGGDQANSSAAGAGAVYVLVRGAGVWSQQAYIKASNTGANDSFGVSAALSADGGTLAVGASGEDSGAMGMGGNQADNSADQSGAAYVLVHSGGVWSQLAYLKASNTGANDSFGRVVALSGDGDTLSVGATGEGSGATGVGGDQADNSLFFAGAVYVY